MSAADPLLATGVPPSLRRIDQLIIFLLSLATVRLHDDPAVEGGYRPAHLQRVNRHAHASRSAERWHRSLSHGLRPTFRDLA
jgi:hypothetical protein